MPICAIDMYSDVIMDQSKNDKLPRAAWNSYNSLKGSMWRHRCEKMKFECLCEICQADKEIHEQIVKKNAILAAIEECKKMIKQNQTLAITD